MDNHPLQEMLERTLIVGASPEELDDLFVRLVNAYWVWRYNLVEGATE